MEDSLQKLVGVSDEDEQFFNGALQFVVEQLTARECADDANDSNDPDYEAMAYVLLSTFFNAGPDAYAREIEEHSKQIRLASLLNPDFRRVVLTGLRMGASRGSGECAYLLASCYFSGELVEQDYAAAATLYEAAEDGAHEFIAYYKSRAQQAAADKKRALEMLSSE